VAGAAVEPEQDAGLRPPRRGLQRLELLEDGRQCQAQGAGNAGLQEAPPRDGVRVKKRHDGLRGWGMGRAAPLLQWLVANSGEWSRPKSPPATPRVPRASSSSPSISADSLAVGRRDRVVRNSHSTWSAPGRTPLTATAARAPAWTALWT